MTPVPMRPWQNAMAIIATFLAAGALLPLSFRFRLTCALAAAAIMLLLLAMRFQAHASARKSVERADTLDRVAQIRAARAKRFDRR